jgi:hypothetical protein
MAGGKSLLLNVRNDKGSSVRALEGCRSFGADSTVGVAGSLILGKLQVAARSSSS